MLSERFRDLTSPAAACNYDPVPQFNFCLWQNAGPADPFWPAGYPAPNATDQAAQHQRLK